MGGGSIIDRCTIAFGCITIKVDRIARVIRCKAINDSNAITIDRPMGIGDSTDRTSVVLRCSTWNIGADEALVFCSVEQRLIRYYANFA